MRFRRNSLGLHLAGVAITAALAVSASHAQIMLTNAGSVALVDVGSSRGMYQWTVSGLDLSQANQLNQQWFWYRIGNDQVRSIDTISAAATTQSAANQLTTTYDNGTIRVSIDYSLTGGGIGQADIAEGIKIWNLTGSALDFHFYQYSDFNLLGHGDGDTISMDTGSAFQSKGDTQIAESIIAPGANHYEAALQGVTLGEFGNSLWKGQLSDTPTAGPGDVTWAFEWDKSIGTGANNVFDITKDKLLDVTVVPEPTSIMLISFGFAGWLLRRRIPA